MEAALFWVNCLSSQKCTWKENSNVFRYCTLVSLGKTVQARLSRKCSVCFSSVLCSLEVNHSFRDTFPRTCNKCSDDRWLFGNTRVSFVLKTVSRYSGDLSYAVDTGQLEISAFLFLLFSFFFLVRLIRHMTLPLRRIWKLFWWGCGFERVEESVPKCHDVEESS